MLRQKIFRHRIKSMHMVTVTGPFFRVAARPGCLVAEVIETQEDVPGRLLILSTNGLAVDHQ